MVKRIFSPRGVGEVTPRAKGPYGTVPGGYGVSVFLTCDVLLSGWAVEGQGRQLRTLSRRGCRITWVSFKDSRGQAV